MGQVFSRKKFSSYLGEERAILDINTSYVPNPSPTPTPTPSMTPTLTSTPTPTLTSSPTPTSTPTLTPTTTPGLYSATFSTGSTQTQACSNTPNVLLYTNQPIFTIGQKFYYDSLLTNQYVDAGKPLLALNGVVALLNWPGDMRVLNVNNCPTPTPTPTRTLTPTPTLTSTPTLTPTPSTLPWTPAQLTGIYDWWSADYGVDIPFFNSVQTWEGHFGTILATDNFNTVPAIYTASDPNWNNRPSITLNSAAQSNVVGGMRGQVSGLDSDKTIIIVAKLIDYSSNKNYMPLMSLGTSDPGPRLALFLRQDINQFDGFNNQPDSETVFGTVITGDYLFSMMRYEQGAGFYEYYSSNNSGIINEDFGIDTGQTTDVSYTIDSLAIGTYLTSADFDKTAKMSVVEFIALDSYITPGEITLLSTYLNNKYGL